MNALSTEIFGKVPTRPSFIIPSRVDVEVVRELEQALGGRDRVAWMVENSLRPGTELMQYMQETRSTGFFTALASSGPEPVVQQVRRMLDSGRHVVFLCGNVASAGAVSDVPWSFLRFADSTSLSVVPVGVSMYNDDMAAPMVARAPYGRLLLHFMAEEPAGPSMAARVFAAWQESTGAALAVHPAVQEASLTEALLHSLLRYPHAEIVDGVDDSRMTYRRVLVYALTLSRRLRHYTSGKRLGIILPPGKLAIIANLACLFAGIAPLNVDYTATPEAFHHLCKESGIERFIATEAFIHKKNSFCWPSQRDIIFIDKELLEVSTSHLRFWELLSSWSGKSFLTSRVGIPSTTPDAEVMLGFTASDGTNARLVSYSHRMLMAAAVQMQSRMAMGRGEVSLCAQPLYRTETLVPSLLLPLLLGHNVVTYPSPTADVRINTMIRQHKVQHIAMLPEHAQRLFTSAEAEQFSAIRNFLIIGEKAPDSLIREALMRYRLTLCACCSVPEFAAPLTMEYQASVQADDAAQVSHHRQLAGNLGCLLPGTYLRVTDLAQRDAVVAPDYPGIVRLYGPTLVRGLLGKDDAADNHYTAPYLGRLNEGGELCILGPVDAFSKVRGELVPHDRAEAALCSLLKINPQDSTRRIALIGMPDGASGGHMLVLLSTVHKKVIPNDTVALYYGLINMKLSPQWAPKQILAVPSIPLLADGSVNYEFCRRGIQSVLRAGK